MQTPFPFGTIRHAVPADVSELALLFATAGLGHRLPSVADPDPTSHLLVLDVESHIRAAAHVVIERAAVAKLDLLVVAPELATIAVDERMLGIVTAMAEAFGCRCLEVTSLLGASRMPSSSFQLGPR